MARVLDGKACAAAVYETLAESIADITRARGFAPSLHVLLAGHDPGSEIYVRNKSRRAAELGIDLSIHRFGDDVTTGELVSELEFLNASDAVDAILVQTPLPRGVDPAVVLPAVDPSKDADGFHPLNIGSLASGNEPFALPCTPSGCIELLERGNIPIEGSRAVVVGRSVIVGRPLALMLLNRNATVTICHSKTPDLEAICGEADILVVAIGKKHFIPASGVKKGAAVIDVGMNRNGDGSVTGDVAPEARDVAGAITPVPGGVGPMTVAMLMKNTVKLASRRVGAPKG